MFWIKRTVLLITIIFLCVPLVLKIFKPITPRPLYGYYEPLKRPVISFGNIISKNFQDMVGPFSERTIPLDPCGDFAEKANVGWCGSAATTDNIHKSILKEIFYKDCHFRGRL